jgi:nucleoside 2-deoxyribosyltransferase
VKIYLAGPIDGCTDSEAQDWRDVAKKKLGEDKCLDPMRRDYRGRTDQCYTEIVMQDLDDIDQSDIILANCWRAGWGTPMEIFYNRYVNDRPVLAVVQPDTMVSPWLRYYASTIYYSLDQALDDLAAGIYG